MRPRFESPRLWGTGRPGETIGFLWRSEDIVAFALQEHLVREVAALASCPPAELALAALADGAPETPRVGLAAHADLSEAGSLVLQRLVEVGYPLALLRHWLPPGMLEGLGVTLDAESTQVLSGHATIAAEMGRLQPEVRAIYRAPPPPHARIAGRVPARDTIAMLGVTGHAPHVVRALLWEGLDWGQRSALKSRLRRRDAADALEGAALLFGDQWGLALRAAERHGRSPPGVSWALLVETATGVRAEDVGARLLALSEGIGGNVQRRTYRGHELIGLDPAADVPWPSSLPRAFFVASEFSVFASDEVYLERFVDTLVDPEAAPPILRTAGWMDTMAELPQAAHATAFVDLCALLHSPAAPGAEGGRGGLLWELQRNRLRGPAAAREAAIRRLREQLKEARRKLRKAITSFHRGLAEDSVAAIERRLERMEASDSHHPMHALQHLRGLGVTMTATTDALEVELRVHAAPLEER